MELLLDTHVFLWWLAGDSRLPPAVTETIKDTQNEIYISAASGWEISIKKAIGKLNAPDKLNDIIEDEGFLHLPITFNHGEKAGSLPLIHKDPFDRMLVAQANIEGLKIVTGDIHIQQYAVKTFWP